MFEWLKYSNSHRIDVCYIYLDPMGSISSSIFTIHRLSGSDSWRDIALTQLPAWKTSEIKGQIAKTKCLLRLDHLKSQAIIYHATRNQKEIILRFLQFVVRLHLLSWWTFYSYLSIPNVYHTGMSCFVGLTPHSQLAPELQLVGNKHARVFH